MVAKAPTPSTVGERRCLSLVTMAARLPAPDMAAARRVPLLPAQISLPHCNRNIIPKMKAFRNRHPRKTFLHHVEQSIDSVGVYISPFGKVKLSPTSRVVTYTMYFVHIAFRIYLAQNQKKRPPFGGLSQYTRKILSFTFRWVPQESRR